MGTILEVPGPLSLVPCSTKKTERSGDHLIQHHPNGATAKAPTSPPRIRGRHQAAGIAPLRGPCGVPPAPGFHPGSLHPWGSPHSHRDIAAPLLGSPPGSPGIGAWVINWLWLQIRVPGRNYW